MRHSLWRKLKSKTRLGCLPIYGGQPKNIVGFSKKHGKGERMKITILDAATLGDDIDFSLFRELGELRVIPMTAPCDIAENCCGADVIILNKIKINRDTLPMPTTVKLVCVAATEVDNIDLAYCQEANIGVCNVKGYCSDSVAQLTLAMALSLVCHLPEYHRFVATGAYGKTRFPNHLKPTYHELAGMTWGLVGYGNIAKRVAAVADALGCRVIVYSRSASSEHENVSMDELCRRADILSLHVPLCEETRHLLDRRRISLMKPSAIVINVARGAVTDERALADAILENRLGGLGADVFSVEPMPFDHPFVSIFDRDNVCLTPHMSWGSFESRKRCMEEIFDNIRTFAQGGRRNRII